jgi:stress response protein SCP2
VGALLFGMCSTPRQMSCLNKVLSGKWQNRSSMVTCAHVPRQVEKLAVVINSFTGQPISKVKFAYIRLIVGKETAGFFGLVRLQPRRAHRATQHTV